MRPRLITFDAAGTLVRVRWDPAQFAVDSMRSFGIELDEPIAKETYTRMLGSRWQAYRELNLTRDPAIVDGFWDELTAAWLDRMGISDAPLPEIMATARKRLYSAESPCFALYDDALPTLAALKNAGFQLAVLSNWDQSLHRVLGALGATPWFDQVFASLEWGPEKPEAELFRIVEREMGIEPGEILHVGDDPMDDLHGAVQAGWRALLVDRKANPAVPPCIGSLNQVLECVSKS